MHDSVLLELSNLIRGILAEIVSFLMCHLPFSEWNIIKLKGLQSKLTIIVGEIQH